MNTSKQVNNKALPKNMRQYWLYYLKYDPKMWGLFVVQDVIHFSRYQVAYIFLGLNIDLLISADPSQGIPGKAWFYALMVFLALGIGESMHIWTVYILRKWKPELRKNLRSLYFNYALGHSHQYYQDHFAGAITRKITELAESSVRIHDNIRFNIFGSLVVMVSASIAMFIVSPIYALLLLIFIFSVTFPVIWRLKKIGERARRFSEIRANVTGHIVDILSNIVSMRNFANDEYEKQRHYACSVEEQKADAKRMLTLIQLENYRRISLVLVGSVMLCSLIIGWQLGMVSIGQMSAVMGQTFSLVGATWMFGWGVVVLADELGYIDDALKTITPPHDIIDKSNAKGLNITKGKIEFKNVNFSYANQDIFTDFCLKIKPEEKVGLIGHSGAGKSTLVNLLLRTYEINSGVIMIDNQDIADVTQNSLRRSISVIPQDTSLFHRSLEANIMYGFLDADHKNILNAAKQAHADDFISKLPDQYETLVGERGVKLSGGERQRIAIARAVLKNSQILILDEATSSLDSISENFIQNSLKSLMKGKTVIAIAHRLSTIVNMDRLIVLDHGKIIEEGTHKELLAQKGQYYKLWEMQSGGFIGEDVAA
jgi:ABC-type multidrug transport system fused ATPase/permease subunit